MGITLFMSFGEMAYIIFQAALGEASHFNNTTPFHRIMFSMMAFGAISLVVVLVWYAVIIAREVRWQLLSQPVVLAVVLGLVLTCMLGGGFGLYLGGSGSHFVGSSVSDANGLWLVNWSKEVGDLRVAHFFGMHAMQVIPLFALMLPDRISNRAQILSILIFAICYSGLTISTFLQALSGQPFIGL